MGSDTIFIGRSEPPGFSPPLGVLKVAWVELGGRLCYVALSVDGASVFDHEGKLLYIYKLPVVSDGADSFCRGVCLCGAKFLCIGTSVGEIAVFKVKGPGQLKHCADLTGAHAAPVFAVASDIADPAGPTVVSADASGTVVIWDFAELVPRLKVGGDIPMFRLASADWHPATTLVLCHGIAVVGYTTGHIRFFSAKQRSKTVEIAAHARGVNALAVSHFERLVASASDDGAVYVWTMPDESKPPEIEMIFSVTLDNQLPVGSVALPYHILGLLSFPIASVSSARACPWPASRSRKCALRCSPLFGR